MRFLILLLLLGIVALFATNSAQAACGSASGRSVARVGLLRANRPVRTQTIFRSTIRTSNTYSSAGVIVMPR